MRGSPVLCRCRDEVMKEFGCPVHGPWVPSVSARLVGVDWVDIVDVVTIRRYSRYHDLDGNSVGMRQIQVRGE